ncbi:NUMOD4 domain-containing protein [Leeuwenhoekiella sp. MAR_2009_132]|uniref:NUMOD4 domain-containing protein n=1 Tax=Leeuwenhoekiella sp. MAR_2009_132 TaxID=1392489 RepID=UPI0006924D62|nr:NUMOD4 domain-containing protein [Leeuwenhoekiella sp. MAR_2009_132]
MKENENWKDIPDFEGLYQVSDLGRLRNLETGRFIGSVETLTGFVKVRFSNKDHFSIHRLVMELFNKYEPLNIRHIDGNKENNALSNLEYTNKRVPGISEISIKLRNSKVENKLDKFIESQSKWNQKKYGNEQK